MEASKKLPRAATAWVISAGLSAVCASVGSDVRTAAGCPFCAATQATLAEEMSSTDVTVICKLVERPAAPADSQDSLKSPDDGGRCTFEVTQCLKGERHLAAISPPPYRIKILYFGEDPPGTEFVAFGIDPANVGWGTPTALTPRSRAYVQSLPASDVEPSKRLPFFAEYLEDTEKLLATDAYDEFARASYADLSKIREKLPKEKLLRWIRDPATSTAHRRQYFCLLSLCGGSEDVPMLEAMIRSDDPAIRPSLDSLIGCHIALCGERGLAMIEDRFLKNEQAEYTDTYSAVRALRFIQHETKALPRARLMASYRLMLSRPKLADLVIPDLTRGEDWSVVPRMAELFKIACEEEQTLWCRVPIINYLRACPLAEAKIALEELTMLDPEAARKARFYFAGADEPPAGSVRPAAAEAK